MATPKQGEMQFGEIENTYKHAGRCRHCGGLIGAKTSREWARLVREKCFHCGKPGW